MDSGHKLLAILFICGAVAIGFIATATAYTETHQHNCK